MPCLQQASHLQRAVKALCLALDIPDPLHKSQIRKFITREDEEYLIRLANTFTVAEKDDHALAALVIVWARLCVDERYRRHIFDDSLKCRVIVAAVERRRCNCCVVAGLQLVCTILASYMGDLSVYILHDVFPAVLDVLVREKDNTLVHELCLRITEKMSHHVYVAGEEKQTRTFIATLIERVPALHHASALKTVMHSTIVCLVGLYKDGHFKHDAQSVRFLVLLLRSGYPRARRLALRWISQTIWNGRTTRDFRAHHFLRLRERALTPDVRTRMEEYGVKSCDSVRLARCMEAFYDAFKGFTIKRDLASLGLRLYCLISEDPRSIHFDDCFARRSGVGKHTPRHFGLDCDDWPDILERCATRVRGMRRQELLETIPERTLGSRTSDDVADVLLLQYTITTANAKARVEVARQMAIRSTSEPFLAYAFTTIQQTVAMQLAISRIRDFYDSGSAPFHAGLASYIKFVFQQLVTGDESTPYGDDSVWDEIVQQSFEVRDLCDEYLAAASPDARDRACILDISIMNHLFIWGPDESSELPQLQNSLKEWRTAVALNESLWGGAFRSETAGVLELILEHIPAVQQWHDPVRRMVAPDGNEEDFDVDFDPPLERAVSTIDLLRWQRRVFAPRAEDPPFDWAEVPRKVMEAFVHPSLRPQRVHECSSPSCKLRTVSLRRCGGCRSVRYCNLECQLTDWAEHKIRCNPRAIYSRPS